MDLTPIFHKPEVSDDVSIRHATRQNHGLDESLDTVLVERCGPALEDGDKVHFETKVYNTQRTVGGMLSGELARRYGQEGLPDGTVRIDFEGVAGQSFRGLAHAGRHLHPQGDDQRLRRQGAFGWPHRRLSLRKSRVQP